jgi:hypothetical protein
MYIPTSRLLLPTEPSAHYHQAMSKYHYVDNRLQNIIASLTFQTKAAEKLKTNLLEADTRLYGGFRSKTKLLPCNLSEPTKYAISEYKRLVAELFTMSILYYIFNQCGFQNQLSDPVIMQDLDYWEKLLMF